VIFSSHEVSEVLVGGRWDQEAGTPNVWKRLDRKGVYVPVGEEVLMRP
jgi:hypothetical protein